MLLLLVEDMLLLGVLQEPLILLGGVHFLKLLALLLETQEHYFNYLKKNNKQKLKGDVSDPEKASYTFQQRSNDG